MTFKELKELNPSIDAQNNGINTIINNVNKDGLSLQYINDQTEDICMVAVKQNG